MVTRYLCEAVTDAPLSHPVPTYKINRQNTTRSGPTYTLWPSINNTLLVTRTSMSHPVATFNCQAVKGLLHNNADANEKDDVRIIVCRY